MYFQRSTSVPVPDIIVLDIGRDQINPTRQILLDNTSDPKSVNVSRTINVKILGINGVKSEDLNPTGDEWLVRGDRQSTWLKDMPEHNKTVAGQWWTEQPDTLQVSVESQSAGHYGITVGSTIDISVLGRKMTAEVVHLRELSYTAPIFNFALIFSTGAFDNAPYSGFAMAKTNDYEVTRDMLMEKYPNQIIFSTKAIGEMVGTIIGGVTMAINYISGLTLIAGVLVLVGAMTAETESKTYNSVVLKMIGGTRTYVARIFMLEYFVLALLGGVLAVLPGYLIGRMITVNILNMPLSSDMTIAGMVSALTILFVLCVGGFILWRILSIKPAKILRNMI